MAMEGDSGGAQLKAALRKYRRAAGGGGYPFELRERCSRFAQDMRARGGSVDQIAGVLGVTAATAKVWSSGVADSVETEQGLSLVPVLVEGDVGDTERGSGRIEVAFANGAVLRAEGMGTGGLAAAIEALARRQS